MVVLGVCLLRPALQIRQQGAAHQRWQGFAAMGVGVGRLRQRQQRGGDVRDVNEAAVHLIGAPHPGAANDERNPHAAFRGEVLEQPQRSGAGLRPARPVQGQGVAAPNVVQGGVEPRQVLRGQPRRVQVGGGGTVVGHQDNGGVGVFTGVAQMVEQAPDAVIHMLQHGRIDLHAAGLAAPFLRRQAGPGRHAGIVRQSAPAFADDAEGLHSL